MSRSKSRFADRIDRLFWFILLIYPLACYLLSVNRTGEFGVNAFVAFLTDYFSVPTIANMFYPALEVFGVSSTNLLVPVLSWCILVELAHCLYDFVVFIPRLAHKWISKAVQDE